MVALLFRDGPHPVGEGQGGGEVGEGEDALQPPDPVALDDAPARNLGLELARLRLGHGRRVAPAGDALLARQATHQPPALRIAVARSLPPSWASATATSSLTATSLSSSGPARNVRVCLAWA